MVCEPKTQVEKKYACPPDLFKKHMRFLKSNGFTPISLKQIDDYLHGETEIPENSVVVTLDDGFQDNYTNAFPIIQQYDIPATIFLATGTLSGKNSWMSAPDFTEKPMLEWTQVREMNASGINFGAHTVRHPRLSELDKDAALIEITDSKKAIEDGLGKSCDYFAYPYGLFNNETPQLVQQAGFKLACSTRSGFNTTARDPFLLHRIEVYGNDPVWKLKQKMCFGTNDASLLFPLTYYKNRLVARFQ